MKFLVVIKLAASAILPVYAIGTETKLPQPKTFTAKVVNIRLNAKLATPDKKPDGTVDVTVPAVIFTKPVEIADVRSINMHAIPELDTIIQYTKANIQGSEKEILSFWLPDERAGKSALLGQAKIFQANRDFHTKYPGLGVIGLVFQSQTSSVLIRRAGRVMAVSLNKKDGQLYLTDHPSNDLELAVIEASFISN